jgi:catechol 2,3-dioxygenase-like lactoylglutathione lyase family enzyme
MGSTEAQSFNHVAIYVADMARSADWYVETLGLTLARASENHTFLRLAEGSVLALFQASDPSQVGSGVHHLALNLPPGEEEAALDRLREQGVELSRRGPSLSFQDPDGYWIHFG